MTTPDRVAPDDDRPAAGTPSTYDTVVTDLRAQVAQAHALAQTAFRDTNRIIRLLTAVTEPSPPEELVDRVLEALSEAFNADLTAVGRISRNHLLITHDCGLPETYNRPADRRWPLGRAVRTATASHRGFTAPLFDDDAEIPASVWRLGVRTGAWLPISYGSARTDTIIVLCRSSGEPFTAAELELLALVTSRLGLVVNARERSAANRRLAEGSHRLAKHLDVQPMIEEAVHLFRGLVDADGAVVAQINDGVAGLAAADGLDRPLPTGSRPVRGLTGWSVLGLHRPYRSHAGDAADADDAGGGDGSSPADEFPPVPEDATVLAVPVIHDQGVTAVMYAWRDATRPFNADQESVALIFANHVATSMTNGRLYRALGRNEAWLRLITDSISDMVSVVDPAGTYLYASPSYQRQLARQPRVGDSITDLLAPDDMPRLRAAFRQRHHAGRIEHRMRRADGDWVWVETVLHTATEHENSLVLSTRVIDDRKQLEAELHHRAFHDPLTGLPNRSLLDQRLSTLLGADGTGGVGVLLCDLDGFKAVNDRLGHEAGDELLIQVAARFARCLRPTDLLVHFSGDEFVFVVQEVCDLDEVLSIGQRVLRTLDDPFTVRGERVNVSASVGGVLGRPGFTTSNELLRDADAAMYAAKEHGRGRIEVFDEAASHRSVDRLAIRSELFHAVDRDELSVHYQPVFEVSTGIITGFEALLRWTHPERGPIPPDVFIPMAEETGAIGAIGAWVLGEATRQLAVWQHQYPGRRITMNVNLSPLQLQEPDLTRRVLDLIDSAGVNPHDVCLEVTENGFVRADVTAFAQALHAAGVQFALDDFGTSYSNLGHLRYFPVRAIKIDRSFVTGLTTDNCQQSVVRGITAMAAALDLDIVAEGIETEDQRQALARLGCTYGQGYLLSRPVPPGQATELLDRDNDAATARDRHR